MMKNMKLLLITCLFVNIAWTQTLDPEHYPPASEWEKLYVKNSDTVLTCMRYYFYSDDTIYFREHPSLKVVKFALADVNPPNFPIRKDYQFQKKGARIANRMFYSHKLDRFYDYYLHAALLSVSSRDIELTKEMDTSLNTQLDSLPKFNPDESGFITKAGCKIIPTKYYCFSDGRYYFAVGDTNYFYIDTSEVLAHQKIDLGKDQRFSTKKRVGFARRFWVGTVIVGGPVMVAIGAGAFFLFGALVVTPPDQFDFDGGGFFVGGLAISTTIFYYVLQSAISNVREYKAYKAAQLYVCL
jgi:hypothetical protein